MNRGIRSDGFDGAAELVPGSATFRGSRHRVSRGPLRVRGTASPDMFAMYILTA